MPPSARNRVILWGSSDDGVSSVTLTSRCSARSAVISASRSIRSFKLLGKRGVSCAKKAVTDFLLIATVGSKGCVTKLSTICSTFNSPSSPAKLAVIRVIGLFAGDAFGIGRRKESSCCKTYVDDIKMSKTGKY